MLDISLTGTWCVVEGVIVHLAPLTDTLKIPRWCRASTCFISPCLVAQKLLSRPSGKLNTLSSIFINTLRLTWGFQELALSFLRDPIDADVGVWHLSFYFWLVSWRKAVFCCSLSWGVRAVVCATPGKCLRGNEWSGVKMRRGGCGRVVMRGCTKALLQQGKHSSAVGSFQTSRSHRLFRSVRCHGLQVRNLQPVT